MGIFDKLRTAQKKIKDPNISPYGQRWDKLGEDGELPIGWAYRNHDFIEQIIGLFQTVYIIHGSNHRLNSMEQ